MPRMSLALLHVLAYGLLLGGCIPEPDDGPDVVYVLPGNPLDRDPDQLDNAVLFEPEDLGAGTDFGPPRFDRGILPDFGHPDSGDRDVAVPDVGPDPDFGEQDTGQDADKDPGDPDFGEEDAGKPDAMPDAMPDAEVECAPEDFTYVHFVEEGYGAAAPADDAGVEEESFCGLLNATELDGLGTSMTEGDPDRFPIGLGQIWPDPPWSSCVFFGYGHWQSNVLQASVWARKTETTCGVHCEGAACDENPVMDVMVYNTRARRGPRAAQLEIDSFEIQEYTFPIAPFIGEGDDQVEEFGHLVFCRRNDPGRPGIEIDFAELTPSCE